MSGDLEVAVAIGDDLEYGTSVYLETEDEEAFSYYYVFDEDFTGSPSISDPLKLNFLGSDIRITAWSTDTQITLRTGSEAVLGQGESVDWEGTTVMVDVIGSETVAITVDGTTEFLSVGDTEEIGDSGVEVEIEDILYTDDVASRAVMLFVGSDVSKAYDHDDSMELFGEPEDTNDAEWIWHIEKNDASGIAGIADRPVLGAVHNQQRNDNDDDGLVGVGGSITLPNNYGFVRLDSLTNVEYAKYEISFDNSFDTERDSNAEVMKISSGLDGEGFVVTDAGTDHKTDTIYLRSGNATANAYLTYIDDSNDPQDVNLTNTTNNNATVDVEFGDTDWALYINVTGANVTNFIEFVQGIGTESDTAFGNIKVDFTQSNTAEGFIGGTAATAETGDVIINSVNVGTADNDVMTGYGTILENQDSNGDRDKVVLLIPDEQVLASVTIAGPGSTSTVASEAVTINPVLVSVIKLDTEVTDPASKNLILIGGPAVNRLTAQVLGLSYPTTGAASGIPENAALLRMVDNAFGPNTGSALIVAGWDADDTRDAASFLQNYAANSLSGNSMTVTGPNTATVGGEATAE